jgi:putative membrane protein
MSAEATTGNGPSVSTELATDRTRLAHDRTLIAWVRTATSLISFGFTIYKFFQYIQEKGTGSQDRLLGPAEFATLMISLGIVSLALATWQHQRDMRALRAMHPEVPYSLATVLAGLISALGLVALLAVILRQ